MPRPSGVRPSADGSTAGDAAGAGIAQTARLGAPIRLRSAPTCKERPMNLEKVVFGFFVLLAATLNFGFFIGDLESVVQHNISELFAAVVVSLIVTVLKFGDRTQLGAIHLAASLVADLQLLAAAGAWAYYANISDSGLSASEMSTIVSLSGGALFANVVSVILLVVETVSFRRH
jgi:hypothetical protein